MLSGEASPGDPSLRDVPLTDLRMQRLSSGPSLTTLLPGPTPWHPLPSEISTSAPRAASVSSPEIPERPKFLDDLIAPLNVQPYPRSLEISFLRRLKPLSPWPPPPHSNLPLHPQSILAASPRTRRLDLDLDDPKHLPLHAPPLPPLGLPIFEFEPQRPAVPI